MGHLLIQGDARRIPLADGSVHCVVTSPPFWGLRDYGTARWEGGDPGCDHKASNYDRGDAGSRNGPTTQDRSTPYRDACGKCGARRVDSQLGLEPTPEAYVARMVEVFREVKRVLRDDGTCWVNLGDSYAGNGPVSQQQTEADIRHASVGNALAKCQRRVGTVSGLKPKDLIGIPWRVALALQADGWYLRSDIIWAKPNPMPESVRDRPTKSHEYVFLLAKRERYYFDAEAVREPQSEAGIARAKHPRIGHAKDVYGDGMTNLRNPATDAESRRRELLGAGRNLRTVWTIATEAYKGAHFATFPRKLVTPCVKAGTSEKGVCPECGAPWERVVEELPGYREWARTQRSYGEGGQGSAFRMAKTNSATVPAKNVTTGWRPTCPHGLDPVPATVLDPFAGSGTTLVVAGALGRRAIGLDLSRRYLAMARRRITRPHARTPRPAPREVEPMPLFDRNGEVTP